MTWLRHAAWIALCWPALAHADETWRKPIVEIVELIVPEGVGPIKSQVTPTWPWKLLQDPPIDQVCTAALTVGADRKAESIEVRGCEPALAKATERALRRWRWSPSEVGTPQVVGVFFRLAFGPIAREDDRWKTLEEKAQVDVPPSEPPARVIEEDGRVLFVAPTVRSLDIVSGVTGKYPRWAMKLDLPPQRCAVKVSGGPDGVPTSAESSRCDPRFGAEAEKVLLQYRWRRGPGRWSTFVVLNYRLER